MVATKPVDFRRGAEGLAALVREGKCADPLSGMVYVFGAPGLKLAREGFKTDRLSHRPHRHIVVAVASRRCGRGVR